MTDVLKDLSLAALGCLAIWYACARSKYLRGTLQCDNFGVCKERMDCDCEMCKSLRVEERA